MWFDILQISAPKLARYEVHGSVLKLVRCEKCNSQYGYVVVAKARGEAYSPWFAFFGTAVTRTRARRDAEVRVQKKLDGIVGVPCPSCLLFQNSMTPTLRSRYRRWMRIFAQIIIGLITVPMAAALRYYLDPRVLISPWTIAAIASGIDIVMILMAVALIRFRRRSAERFDPNAADFKWRQRLAEKHAIHGPDLATMIHTANVPEYTVISVKTQ